MPIVVLNDAFGFTKDRSQRHDIRWRDYRESEISMRASPDIEQTINSHGDAVWRACLVYLAPSEAEDAFQNTFMKYALCDKAFNDEEHKKAWLLRVAINICKDVLKAARRKDVSLDCQLAQANHVKGAFAGEALSRGTEEDSLKGAENISTGEASDEVALGLSEPSVEQSLFGLREILGALNSLGDPPKTELYLSLYEGYTAKEIAVMTGEPEGTVYSWISRGKKLLREALR